mmetsp:Transcript_11783/g.30186  ORF Transcript_11783/g.30186 Transcript_11783/m.30186 type:complete len:267 (-) Transcript_11783:200-1000(-)
MAHHQHQPCGVDPAEAVAGVRGVRGHELPEQGLVGACSALQVVVLFCFQKGAQWCTAVAALRDQHPPQSGLRLQQLGEAAAVALQHLGALSGGGLAGQEVQEGLGGAHAIRRHHRSPRVQRRQPELPQQLRAPGPRQICQPGSCPHLAVLRAIGLLQHNVHPNVELIGILPALAHQLQPPAWRWVPLVRMLAVPRCARVELNRPVDEHCWKEECGADGLVVREGNPERGEPRECVMRNVTANGVRGPVARPEAQPPCFLLNPSHQR